MEPSLDEIRRHAAALPDEMLLEVNREDLTTAAQGIYEAELASRGLAWPAEVESDATAEAEAAAAKGGALVSLAKYDSMEEARFARDLLRNEEIPCWFAGELALHKGDADPLAALELLTPSAFVEQAQLLLSSEISDEELARQAEEAGGAFEDE
ncbi:MAG: hypothetical protein K2X03_21395 [Bryobacteraceae bacterium]|nr:hypothetical protein [Bryobacteraceae bacterium]